MNEPKIAIVGLSGQSVFLKVDHFHNKEETLVAKSIYVEPGGKGFNQAVAASRLGAKVSFLSAVGDDAYGLECEQRLIHENVRPYFVRKSSDKTALATIITNQDGDNQVTVYPGAKLDVMDVNTFEDEIKCSDLILLQQEVPHEVNLRVIGLALKYKVPIILNPAPAKRMPQSEISQFTLMTPNEIEAKEIFSLPHDSSFEELKDQIVLSEIKQLIVTLGSKGSLVYSNQEFTLIPSRKVESIDTTGAGDTYTAAVCVRLLKGDSLIQAAKYATVAASLCVQKASVLSSLPREEEVKKVIDSNKNASLERFLCARHV